MQMLFNKTSNYKPGFPVTSLCFTALNVYRFSKQSYTIFLHFLCHIKFTKVEDMFRAFSQRSDVEKSHPGGCGILTIQLKSILQSKKLS